MMSQTSRYALNVLGYLASRTDRLIRSEELAAATGLPPNYLAKVLNQLRKGGLVISQKGWGGGFQLQPGAGSRTVGEVVRIMEGPAAVEREDCVFGRPHCDPDHPCPLHDRWAEFRDNYTGLLADTTIADLAGR